MISPSTTKLQFPGLAEVASFASRLLLGFLIDTRRCLLIARLTEDERTLALNSFHAQAIA